MLRNGLLTAVLVAAQAGAAAAAGTTGADLMGRPQGARPMAMGDAYVSLADDPYALVYNPAGLGVVRRAQASTYFETGMAGVRLTSLLAAAPAGRWGGFGLGITTLDAGRLTVFNPDGSQNSVDAQQDALVTAGWGWATRPELADWGRFAAGAGLKYYRSTLVEQSHASAEAVDLGGLWETPAGPTLGASLTSLGPGVGYQGGIAAGTEDPLPRTLRVGASWTPPLDGRRLLATVELVAPRDEPKRVDLGAEYALARFARVRAGYKVNDGVASVTTGVGFSRGGFAADYGFAANSELGDQQFFSLSWAFGPTAERPSYAEVRRAHLDAISRYPAALYARRRWFEATEAALADPSLPKSSETVAAIRAVVARALAAGLAADATAYAYAQAYRSRFAAAPLWPQAVADLEAALVHDPLNDELQGEILRDRPYAVRRQRELEAEADALYQKAVAAYGAKDYGAAIADLREALKRSPAHEAALKLMDLSIQGSVEALVQAGLKEKAQAPPQLPEVEAPPAPAPGVAASSAAPAERPAPVFDPERAEKLYHDGLMAYANGDLRKALSLWEEALRLDPYHQRAKNALERVREDLRGPAP